MEAKKISWQAPEFEHHEKEVLWSWISILIAIIFLVTAIIIRNFAFAFFVVMAEILVLVWGNRTPKTISFELNEKNLVINGREKHKLNELDYFGFIELGEDEPMVELCLAFRKLRPMMKVLAPQAMTKSIEQHLKLFGPKTDLEPTFSDVIERLLRF